MYLKSLELQGFKSFPDKIKLDFDKGITAVVGPNGSGKSNIGDAVRWVLGEQSSKTLRGAKMEDVIFAGTQTRKPMGFAQVTLEIVNDRGILPIDAEEVAVTRKLFRSGESEYMINGNSCRLKDICELFMDTGMGRDGYSIIGQGRIAEIVSQKSGERRDIFEEAAGISKFRYKKAEAERRLSSAEENLLRLKDIVTALEARVEPLRIQSEKAAKFIDLSEQKKALEITVWVRQLSDLKTVLNELEEKILISTSEYDNTEADIERTEQRMQELTRDMQDSQLKIEELRQKIHSMEQANTALHSEIAVCENEIRHCEENIAEYDRRREDAKSSDAETSAEIEEKLSLIRKAEDDIKSARLSCDETEKELSQLLTEQESADRQAEKESAELNALYITRSKYTAAIESSKNGRGDMERQLELAENQSAALTESLTALENEKKEVESGNSLLDEKKVEQENRLAGLERLYKNKAEKFSDSEKRLNETNLRIREIEQKLNFLTGLENSMEGFNNAVRQVLRASQQKRLRGIFGSVAQLITVENRYSTAIETALGAALQNIVVENEEAAKRCIAFLKETRAGRATFLPLTSVRGNRLSERLEGNDGFVALAADLVRFEPQFTGIVNSLLGRIAIAEDIDSATVIAKRFGYKFRIVTLDGQVINAGGSFTGGSTVKSAGVLTRKTEIDELSSQKDDLADAAAQLKSDRNRLKAEADKYKFDIEDARDKLRNISSDRIRFESEIKRIDSVYGQTLNQIKSAEEQTEIIRNRLEKTDSDAAEAEKRLGSINEQIEAKESSAGISSEKKNEIHSRRNELSEKISALKIRETELIKDKENLSEAVKRIEEQRRALGDDSAKLVIMTEEQNRIIEEKRRQIEEANKKLSGADEEIKKINAGISDTRSESREKEAETTQLRRKSRELSDSKEKFAAEKTRLEERRANVQNSCDDILRSMEEQYELYLSEAEKMAKPVEDLNKVQRELNDIKQKIRSLGNVNVAAIEEYKEVSEQYEFMSGQLNDVEDSKKKLENIISELTETMKKQFAENFALINENFKSIFTELFGGGKAELVLTDPEDVLESGIEINVAPPGKVIKSLSLLSGGEQAFVAIALYFAILKIKPAPFCILDEIEAALDDVNVTRYAKYLRHFTDTTQFITVTHRRGTMEEADVMYGVTMQQKGVSKLLKMDQKNLPDENAE